MLGYPPTPPPPRPGSLAADRPTRRPPRFGSTKGGVRIPPPYNPQNGCTPLRVAHWLAAAPVLLCNTRHGLLSIVMPCYAMHAAQYSVVPQNSGRQHHRCTVVGTGTQEFEKPGWYHWSWEGHISQCARSTSTRLLTTETGLRFLCVSTWEVLFVPCYHFWWMPR